MKPTAVLFVALAVAQQNPNAPQNFVKVAAPVVALTHARVIDGTGAPARANQTIVIRDGAIAALGDAITVPGGATVVDLTGRSVIPGLVMLHEHLYYTTGPACTDNSARASRGSTSPAASRRCGPVET
jgi:imidazolonepropionase-like amidohydrolase